MVKLRIKVFYQKIGKTTLLLNINVNYYKKSPKITICFSEANFFYHIIKSDNFVPILNEFVTSQ